MSSVAQSSPQTKQQVIDTYFMEHRARLVDIAAYLDRIERGQGEDPQDFRQVAFQQAIAILTDGMPHRAQRILTLLSDQTTQLPQSAEGMKGASGAVNLDTGDLA